MSRRLLLVDDDDSIREVARLGLERVGGWAVTAAPSGAAALELVRGGERFQAVVLDVMMPGLDGPSTLRGLRETDLGDEVPIIFLTAKLRPSDRERLHSLGAAGVIAKPFDPMGLSAEVERLLGASPTTSQQGVLAQLAPLWDKARRPVEAQVETIEIAVRATPPSLAQKNAAIAAAHKLAGLLGTFGLRRGTELAREIELGLEANGNIEPGSLYPLAVELRAEITGARSESRSTSSGST